MPFFELQDEAVVWSPSRHVWVFVKMALRRVCTSSASKSGIVLAEELTVWNEVRRKSMLRAARNLQSSRAATTVGVMEGDLRR